MNSDSIPTELPESLCKLCRWGTVVTEVHPHDEEEDALVRFVKRETSFCRCPLIVGRDGEPLDMNGSVTDCQGFRPQMETTDKPKPKRRKRRGRRQRRGDH